MGFLDHLSLPDEEQNYLMKEMLGEVYRQD